MSLFPILEIEPVVQVNDKTRLSAVKSYVAKGQPAVTNMEIDPGTGTFVSVFSAGKTADWFLDFQWSTAGSKIVQARITVTGPVTATMAATINVVTAESDKLFSKDSDLIALESDILKYVRPGRNSFLDFHRKAQEKILAWADEHGLVDADGNRLTKASFVDVEEVRQWSIYQTMVLICYDQSNAVGDIWAQKAQKYESDLALVRQRAYLRYDFNNNGVIDLGERSRISSITLRRE